MVLFTIYGLFTKMLYDGDGRKTSKYTKDETKEKNSPFGCPPIPASAKWRPTVFWYPKISRIPNLMGQKKTGLDAVWAVNGR